MAKRKGYDAWETAPIVAGRCSKHGTEVGWTRVCFVCHLEGLAKGGGQNAAVARERLAAMGR